MGHHQYTATVDGVARPLSKDEVTRLSRWRVSTFWVMLLGYVGYYLGRKNLSAALPLLEEVFGYSNEQLATIAAASELAYAGGKLVNGPLGDKLGGKKIFLLGLAGALVCNVLFALADHMGPAIGVETLTLFVVIWCACRFFLSMGWGGIAKTIGAWYEPERNGTIMGYISLNFQFGGVAASLFAGFLVGTVTTAAGALESPDAWKVVFFWPAAIMAGVWVWSFFASRATPQDVIPGTDFGDSLEGKRILTDYSEVAALPAEASTDAPALPTDAELRALKPSVKEIALGLLKNPLFLCLLLYSFMTTLLRSVFVTWSVKFFKDLGMETENAIYCSVLFGVLGAVGTIGLGIYTDKYSVGGDRARPMWIMLSGMVPALAVMAWMAGGDEPSLVPIVIASGFAGFFLLGPYSMTSGCLALDIAGSEGAGTCCGMLDGLGYVGGAIGLWAAGMLADNPDYGWAGVFWACAGCAVLAVGSAFLMSLQFQRIAKAKA